MPTIAREASRHLACALIFAPCGKRAGMLDWLAARLSGQGLCTLSAGAASRLSLGPSAIRPVFPDAPPAGRVRAADSRLHTNVEVLGGEETAFLAAITTSGEDHEGYLGLVLDDGTVTSSYSRGIKPLSANLG